MRKFVVFDVENVLFNVVNVEKWLKGSEERFLEGSKFEKMEELRRREEYLKGSFVKCKMFEGVRENLRMLMSLRKSGRVKVFVLSSFKNELVERLLGLNEVSFDGFFKDLDGLFKSEDVEKEKVVYFSGNVENLERGREKEVKSVACLWGKKFEKGVEGIKSFEGIFSEMGLKKAGEDRESSPVAA